jgi:iron(III) transport system substrate-binding protein
VHSVLIRIVALAAALATGPLAAQATINLYCSSPNTAWCQGMAVGFEKSAGVHVAVMQKATGEMLAQIIAERANPRGDVWWAGPADAFLQAAEQGLLAEYRSPNVAQLYDWAQRITETSHGKVSGVYGGILSLGYNTEIAAHKKYVVPKCWKDLLDPAYKGDVMLGNPSASGTAYLMLSTLVQVFGEDEAFRYMAQLNRNVSSYARSGIGPMTAVKQGEIFVGSSVLHGVINEIVRGYPVLPILPCEGVGYEIG